VTLGPRAVHVYSACVDPLAPYDQASWSLLDRHEQERAGRFVFDRDRAMFVAAHALLRTALSRYADVAPHAWRFETNRFGKPSIDPVLGYARLDFNLAHTSGLVACAISRSAVGIDVEALDRRVDAIEIAGRFFTSGEVAWLSAGPDDQRDLRFLELWTLKEAYLKAVGVGLSHSLNTFGFTVDDGGAIHFDPPEGDIGRWHFELHSPTDRHRLAVAIPVRNAEDAKSAEISFHLI